MITRQKITLILVSFSLISGVISCAKTDSDKIAEAQNCVDKSTPTTSVSCLDKISGLESAGAYNLRCSAMFIQEGFNDGSKIVNAFKSIDPKAGGTGASNMQNFMGILAFSSQANISTDYTNIINTYSYCYKSGSKGALMLAAYAYLANGLYSYFRSADTSNTSCPSAPSSGVYPLGTCMASAGSNASVKTAVENAIDTNASSGSSAASLQTTFGAVLRTVYAVNCTGSSTNSSLCSSLTSAVNSGSGATSDRALFVNFLNTIK